MSIKKVLAFTGIRSDYDLMSGLYKKINEASEFELGLIVSGAHLSDHYGYTVQYIKQDGLPIIARIESLIDSNSTASRIKSASIVLQNCIHTVESFAPDVILFAGDREDVIIAAMIGAYLEIPTIHFFGGDHASDGNVDNPVRHATSKLSSIHIVMNEIHKQRLIALGEPERRIFVMGNPALDKFISEPIIERGKLIQTLVNHNLQQYAIMIHHPILGHSEMAGQYFEEILSVLKEKKIFTFVSFPNTDAGNKESISIIKKYKGDPNFMFYKNLERKFFVNLLRHALFIIGNSSLGLLEAPMMPLGVVNVGARQRGRLAAQNVIFVDQGVENIKNGIEQVCSEEFQKNLCNTKSPYGNGQSVNSVFKLLKTIDLAAFMHKEEDPLKLYPL